MKKYSTVDDFLADQPQQKLEQIQAIRQIITDIDPSLQENIKWNAPTYVHDGVDRITFNLLNKEGVVKLVLHMGAAKKEDKSGKPILADDEGLLEWASDIRGAISFADLSDIQAKEPQLKKTIKRWLAISA